MKHAYTNRTDFITKANVLQVLEAATRFHLLKLETAACEFMHGFENPLTLLVSSRVSVGDGSSFCIHM